MKRLLVYLMLGWVGFPFLAFAIATGAGFFWLVDLWRFPAALACVLALFYFRFPYPVPVLAFFGATRVWEWSTPSGVLLTVASALTLVDQGRNASDGTVMPQARLARPLVRATGRARSGATGRERARAPDPVTRP